LSDAKIRSNGRKYGKLYNWEAAIHCCPDGWHLPTIEEWNELLQYAETGENLMSKSGWVDYEEKPCSGMDKFGFSALPGGIGWDDGFWQIGQYGVWWSASTITDDEAYPDEAYAQAIGLGYDGKITLQSDYKEDLYSVRCVKD